MIRRQEIVSFDGTRLALHRLGEGRPLVLLHGLFSSAEVNWVRFGHAERIADAGFEVIMPDLRAHGQSAAPHDPAAWPADVLVRDVAALVEALGLDEFDLCGFSLGARTAVRAVIDGLAPRRLVLAGMGLEGLTDWARRSGFFLRALDRFDEIRHGDPEYFAKAFMQTMKTDRVAARLLLGSVRDIAAEDLARITMPALVVCGSEDSDNGSAPSLAGRLADASYAEVPGTHMSSVTQRQLGEAIASFLSA